VSVWLVLKRSSFLSYHKGILFLHNDINIDLNSLACNMYIQGTTKQLCKVW